MASHLSVFMGTPAGTVKRDFGGGEVNAALDKDAFGKLLDRDQPAAPAASSAVPAKDSAAKDANAATPASNDGSNGGRQEAPAAEAVASTEAPVEEGTEATTETLTLPEDLLAALTSLANGEIASLEDLNLDPEKLAALKKALEDLATSLGMDMSAMLQQLQQLAQPVAEGAVGAEPEFAAKLTQWVGEKLNGVDPAKAPEIDAAFAKVLDAAKALSMPTEPELATPDLKLEEPVLTGKANAEKPAEASAEPKIAVATTDKPAPEQVAAKPGQEDKTLNAARASAETTVQQAPQTAQTEPAQAARTDVTLAAPRVIQAGYQTSQQQLNLPQLAFEMARQAQDGNTRFQIRLDPPELGRIDVKLDIDKGGQVTARLTVEKSETLDLMQRDRTALERALQQSGLDTSKTNLEFSLKQNPFANDNGNLFGDRDGSGGRQGGGDGAADEEAPVPAVTLYRGNVSASGVNIIA